jgi:hypothetical protein
MNNMNSNALTISSVLAAVAAIALLPVSLVAAAFTFTAVGILSVFAADYGRSATPLSTRVEVIPFNSTVRSAVLFRQAA